MTATAKFKYKSADGQLKDGELHLEDYRKAEKFRMTVSGFLNAKYSDADQRYGTAFEQGCSSLGIHAKDDPSRGIRAATVGELMDGTASAQMAGENLAQGGTIVSPSTQGTTPSSRVFFPEVVLTLMNEKLVENNDPEAQIWQRMISSRETIGTEMFTQPLIDVTAPRSERSLPTSQNAMPRTMISITSSQYSKAITTSTIGLQISEQAQRNFSIDLTTTVLAQQAQGERLAKLWEDINDVVTGNIDAGQAPLPATAASTYDAAATGGVMTQRAWLKALYDESRKVSYDSIICDLDTFLAIQDRANRPLAFDPSATGPNVGALGTYGLNVEPSLLNWAVGVPNVMLVPAGTIAASHALMFDSRYALRQVVNASASYAATESMVLQRSDIFRVDFGALTYRLMDEAFQYLDFS